MKEKRIEKVKGCIYLFFDCMNENTMRSPAIYILFLMVESIQSISLLSLYQSTLDEYSQINTAIYNIVVLLYIVYIYIYIVYIYIYMYVYTTIEYIEYIDSPKQTNLREYSNIEIHSDRSILANQPVPSYMHLPLLHPQTRKEELPSNSHHPQLDNGLPSSIQ